MRRMSSIERKRKGFVIVDDKVEMTTIIRVLLLKVKLLNTPGNRHQDKRNKCRKSTKLYIFRKSKKLEGFRRN